MLPKSLTSLPFVARFINDYMTYNEECEDIVLELIDDFSISDWAEVLQGVLEDANKHTLAEYLPNKLMQVVQSTPLKPTEQIDLYIKLCNAIYESI